MTDAPERIWASPEHPDENGYGGFWIASKVAPSVEYVRADLVDKQLQEAREALSAIRKLNSPEKAWEAIQAKDIAIAFLTKYA